VSHELRTPLTIIQGNVEGMLDGLYTPDEARLRVLLEQGQVLSRLVDDLRTLALAESGSLALKREPTDLAVLVSDIAASFHSQAEQSGLEISIESSGELPLIEIDPVRMREVLSNLVANAIRYSFNGKKILIQISRTEIEGRFNQVVAIHDRGKGISAVDLPHVFDRFYKTRDSSGLGLGLTIARNLVEAHGGTIQAENQPEGGTTFRITLPEEPASQE
jgi:signal transduction histidine kinase